MDLTLKQTTALFGLLYACLLLFFLQKLKAVWKGSKRTKYGLVLFTVLFLLSVGSFAYVYFVMKRKHVDAGVGAGADPDPAGARRALQDMLRGGRTGQKDAKALATSSDVSYYAGKILKVGTALLLSFGCLHFIVKRS